MISKFKNYIRANHWWMFKAAPILGFAYFYCSFFDISFGEQLKILLLSAMTIIGIAGLGYAINDWNDREVDKKAGKKNPFEKTTSLFALFIFGLLFTIALVPWVWLKSSSMIWIALGFQLFLFLVYAHPLTRLKEKSYWGPICDALYGHAIPIIIACLTYQQYLTELPYNKWWFYGSLFTWQFFKGLRNILLHQLDDYENDIASGITTLTTLKGKEYSFRKILLRILPMESISLLVFLGSITLAVKSIWILLLLFILSNLLGQGILKSASTKVSNFSNNSVLYFLNNFYEVYLPLYFILLAISENKYFLVVLFFHFLAFPSSIQHLYQDIQKSRAEFWGGYLKPVLYEIGHFLKKN